MSGAKTRKIGSGRACCEQKQTQHDFEYSIRGRKTVKLSVLKKVQKCIWFTSIAEYLGYTYLLLVSLSAISVYKVWSTKFVLWYISTVRCCVCLCVELASKSENLCLFFKVDRFSFLHFKTIAFYATVFLSVTTVRINFQYMSVSYLQQVSRKMIYYFIFVVCLSVY